MKFHCGRNRRLKLERLEEWHRWFAWYPVKIGAEDCRWLEWVERRMELRSIHDSCWWHKEHREITK